VNRWPSTADARGGSPGADLDFLPGEDGGEQVASLWLGSGQQPRQRLDHRGAGAEPSEHLGQFRADPIRGIRLAAASYSSMRRGCRVRAMRASP